MAYKRGGLNTELKIQTVPLFSPKPNPLRRITSAKDLDSIPIPEGLRPGRRSLTSPLLPKGDKCSCPQVMVADDDAFQHLYYRGFFTKMSYFIDLSFSGEELLEKYAKIKNGCQGCQLKLVIVDYQMGDNKMNGVEVCKKLREIGYKGALVLRTSETEECLKKNHRDFDSLINQRIITTLVSKSDAKGGRKIVDEYLMMV